MLNLNFLITGADFELFRLGVPPSDPTSLFGVQRSAFGPPRPLASGRVDPFAVYLYIIYTYISPPLPLPDAPARPTVPGPEKAGPPPETAPKTIKFSLIF